ncbi:MAG: hypothetical protein CM15mP86_08910 [Gammaproteobacteria bacterium]|nr:MAG: hypothetical protein CM15mP86_08910 [Gammaproteobacteria bacterium]
MLNWDDYNESEKTQKPQLQKEQTKSMESEQTLSVQEEGPRIINQLRMEIEQKSSSSDR